MIADVKHIRNHFNEGDTYKARDTLCASLRRRLKVPCDKAILKAKNNFARHFAPTL